MSGAVSVLRATNIRRGGKCPTMTNSLAFCILLKIKIVAEALEWPFSKALGLYYKSFTAVVNF
jgi:hypothetical protein